MELLTPPGMAMIMDCPDCDGAGCSDCKGTGKELWRGCPECGDVGWDFVAGDQTERSGMICRLGCGARWSADDPRWVIQHL